MHWQALLSDALQSPSTAASAPAGIYFPDSLAWKICTVPCMDSCVLNYHCGTAWTSPPGETLPTFISLAGCVAQGISRATIRPVTG